MLSANGKVVLITGGSSGIGLETARCLAQAGANVFEMSRRDSEKPGVTHISGDVTCEPDCAAAVKTVIEKKGGIDILILCAGFGISGAVEFTKTEDARRQVDVNFFGAVNMVKAALPYMRKARNGKIIIISSVAGAIPIPFQTFYSVTKAALNSYAGALRNEVRPYGISVCAIMPGDISTGFTAARVKETEGDREYGGRISRSVARMEKDEQNGMSAAAAGRYIAKMSLRSSLPPSMAIGLQYKFFTMLVRLLPSRLVSRLVYGMYAS